MKKVFLFGISGRMGAELKNQIEAHPNLICIGGYSKEDKNMDLAEAPDIVVDFSLPDAFDDLKTFMTKYPCALVSGTTGLSDDQKSELKNLGKASPVFWAANMSFGVFLMAKLTEFLAEYDENYNLHVEETHHIHKKDKPSGTAIIVEDAAKKKTQKLGETISHREGEVFGIHRFIATNEFESLEIRHEAFSRGLFAKGALDVAVWLSDQKPGFYNMDNYFENSRS
ncbi:MAG: hypothetical protein HRT44_05310 [Bdellovibrionales bacterium]|nr:hypothetical protein [Bdellovibrionales bacterium]NQZ18660.1 hypothetical protein [Bdellovibrionales bacterium]